MLSALTGCITHFSIDMHPVSADNTNSLIILSSALTTTHVEYIPVLMIHSLCLSAGYKRHAMLLSLTQAHDKQYYAGTLPPHSDTTGLGHGTRLVRRGRREIPAHGRHPAEGRPSSGRGARIHQVRLLARRQLQPHILRKEDQEDDRTPRALTIYPGRQAKEYCHPMGTQSRQAEDRLKHIGGTKYRPLELLQENIGSGIGLINCLRHLGEHMEPDAYGMVRSDINIWWRVVKAAARPQLSAFRDKYGHVVWFLAPWHSLKNLANQIWATLAPGTNTFHIVLVCQR